MKKEFVNAASEQITGKEKRSKINIFARKFVKKLIHPTIISMSTWWTLNFAFLEANFAGKRLSLKETFLNITESSTNSSCHACREVSDCSKSRLVSQIHSLTHQIQLFFLECQHQQCGVMDYSHFPGYTRHHSSARSLQLQEIKHEQEKLLYLCDSIKLSVRKDTQKVPLIKLITLIGSTFSRVVELMLGVQIKTCVDSLVSARNQSSVLHNSSSSVLHNSSSSVLHNSSDEGVTVSLSVMTSLALEGNNLCRLLVQHGAVDSLLHLCQHSSTTLDTRVSALRALGSICCVMEGIIRLVENNQLL